MKHIPVEVWRQEVLAHNQQFVYDTVKESVRVSKGKPVYSFTWHKYHDQGGQSYSDTLMEPRDLYTQYEFSWIAGAEGALMWGWEPSPLYQNLNFESYAAATFGPLILQAKNCTITPTTSGTNTGSETTPDTAEESSAFKAAIPLLATVASLLVVLFGYL